MLMMAPAMIWSARTLIESHACSSDSSIPAMMAASTPSTNGAVRPKTGVGVPGPMMPMITDSANQPVKAAVSMMPHNAARQIGTASWTATREMKGSAFKKYSMNWNTRPSTGIPLSVCSSESIR